MLNMDHERRQNIALMKYLVFAPLISGLSEDYASLKAYYRDDYAKGIMSPGGGLPGKVSSSQ